MLTKTATVLMAILLVNFQIEARVDNSKPIHVQARFRVYLE